MAALEQNVGRSFSASSGGRHNRPNTQNIATTAELLLAVHDVYCVRVGEQAECVKVMEAHRRRFETHRVIWDVYSFFRSPSTVCWAPNPAGRVGNCRAAPWRCQLCKLLPRSIWFIHDRFRNGQVAEAVTDPQLWID